MILLVLVCTLIGWVAGAPLIGLAIGVSLWLLDAWAESRP